MFSHTDSRPNGNDRTIDRCANEINKNAASIAQHLLCKF